MPNTVTYRKLVEETIEILPCAECGCTKIDSWADKHYMDGSMTCSKCKNRVTHPYAWNHPDELTKTWNAEQSKRNTPKYKFGKRLLNIVRQLEDLITKKYLT